MIEKAACGVIVAAAMAFGHAAYARCSVAGNTQLQAGTLFAIYPDGTLMPLRWPASSVAMRRDMAFLYVIDVPGQVERRTSGVLAVRLVTTTPNGAQRRPQSTHVRLKRDSVDTRRRMRPAWTGRIKSRTYYNFHDPDQLPASDSYLRRDFHTEYVHVAGSPEKSTYEQRGQFHFPKMSGGTSVLFSRMLGGTGGYFEAPDKRYEAQLKYYRPRPDERCVQIQPDLQGDDIRLHITISNLDRGQSATWRIDWGEPTQ